MKLCRGTYIEVTEPLLECDGDYLKLSIRVRVVSNGFDNVRTHSYPDSYGEFVQGMSGEQLEEKVKHLCNDMREDLEVMYKFSQAEIRKVTEFHL